MFEQDITFIQLEQKYNYYFNFFRLTSSIILTILTESNIMPFFVLLILVLFFYCNIKVTICIILYFHQTVLHEIHFLNFKVYKCVKLSDWTRFIKLSDWSRFIKLSDWSRCFKLSDWSRCFKLSDWSRFSNSVIGSRPMEG